MSRRFRCFRFIALVVGVQASALWAPLCLGYARSSRPTSVAAQTAARTPQRTVNRSSSFEWFDDVRDRLRILGEHAADAAREQYERSTSDPSPGRFAPLPPAAGDGARR